MSQMLSISPLVWGYSRLCPSLPWCGDVQNICPPLPQIGYVSNSLFFYHLKFDHLALSHQVGCGGFKLSPWICKRNNTISLCLCFWIHPCCYNDFHEAWFRIYPFSKCRLNLSCFYNFSKVVLCLDSVTEQVFLINL